MARTQGGDTTKIVGLLVLIGVVVALGWMYLWKPRLSGSAKNVELSPSPASVPGPEPTVRPTGEVRIVDGMVIDEVMAQSDIPGPPNRDPFGPRYTGRGGGAYGSAANSASAVVSQRPPNAMGGFSPLAPPSISASAMMLLGVVAGRNPIAVLKFGNDTAFMRVGDSIPDGPRLMAVYPDRAVFRLRGKEVALKIGEAPQADRGLPPAGPSFNVVPSAPF